MDPITIGAGVIAVSFLVPLIITCVVAGIVIVATFFVTRFYYKSKAGQAAQRADAYQEQYEREVKVRQDLCHVAEQAGIDMQTLIDISQKHQAAFQQALSSLVKSLHESAQTTEKLNQVASSIQTAANHTAGYAETLSEELKTIKLELTSIHKKLTDTEKALADREKELQLTIAKLKSIEPLTEKSHAQQDIIQAFIENSQFIQEAIEVDINQANEEALFALREENLHLRSKIQQLTETVSRLNLGLIQSNDNNHKNLHDIQSLLNTNAQLSHQIDHLTHDLENQNTTYQPRLFKG